MTDAFTKKPTEKGYGGGKRRKRIMRTFKLNEISAVDRPAQAHAKMTIMKRADDSVEKLILLTSEDEGHQHSINIDSWDLEQGGGHTSHAGGDATDGGHSHAYVMNVDGSITISVNDGHSHSLEGSELLGRLQLVALLDKADEEAVEVVRMRKQEDGKEFQASDFALVPDATAPETWKYRLVRKAGSNPDRRLVGNAVAALKRGHVSKNEIASFTRRVRSAWAQSHSSSPRSDMPSVLKRVFS